MRAWVRQGVLGFALLASNAVLAAVAPEASQDAELNTASAGVKWIARWAIDAGDSAGFPYLVIDKVNARVYVFDARGQLQGADAALLGMGRGDRSGAGIGTRRLSTISPDERITPAGRFMASIDRDAHGTEVLLIDYDASIALHPVVKGEPIERRAERLQSPTAQDHRTSFGCINVPPAFYRDVISRAFGKTNGVVYILPEASSVQAWFEKKPR